MYYELKFNNEQIAKAKKETKEKNERLGYNNLDQEKETRWVGVLGEICFEEWLKSYGYSGKYKYYYQPDKVDKVDFTVGNFQIDVKTASANFYPKGFWDANVFEEQAERIKRVGNPINTLVFARFILPENKAVLVGWRSVKDFFELSRFVEAGTQLTNFVATTPMYQIRLDQLYSMEDLDRNIIC